MSGELHIWVPSKFSTFYGLTQMKIMIGYIYALYATKMGSRDSGDTNGRPSLGQGPFLVLQWTFPWPYITPNMALYILTICVHSMQQKWDQGTLATQRSTLIGSRTHLGPSMDPAMALQYSWHGPLYIGYICAFSATKRGSRYFGDTKVHPHWV